jgi:hypothetical protein
MTRTKAQTQGRERIDANSPMHSLPFLSLVQKRYGPDDALTRPPLLCCRCR